MRTDRRLLRHPEPSFEFEVTCDRIEIDGQALPWPKFDARLAAMVETFGPPYLAI
jgi:hypothetical protein